MILNIFITLFSLAAFFYVIMPLISKSKEAVIASQSQKFKTLEDLLWQRDQMVAAMRDLDFEFNMKKLSETDHHEVVAEYQSNLKQLDDKIGVLVKRKSLVAELEKEILRQRESMKEM